MFSKFFRKSKSDVAEDIPKSPAQEALLRQIKEKSKADPLIGAKIGAQEVFARLLNAMKTDQGVHIESLFVALSALAGYACQANVREQLTLKGHKPDSAFLNVDTKSGKTYFIGESIDGSLFTQKLSIYSLVGGAARDAGCQNFPDIEDIVKHTAGTFGDENFGIPRYPEGHTSMDKPANYLKGLWPKLLIVVEEYCPNPILWPVLYGMAIQKAIDSSKDTLDPEIAMSLIMETAIPMSKIDFDAL